ncbi:MAG: hypothetical protein LBU87_03385 [Lactobacillales bacterium]|jgi:Zn-dependent peptidase ImmA (M78 family)|nr:hypothetical protein [Lactobacillales bacterium]
MIDKIKIGGITYKISCVDPAYCENNMGKVVQISEKIFLNKGLSSEALEQTLLHEILHVIYNNAALSQGDDEERIVTAISNGLYALFVDNPHAFKFTERKD